MLHVRVQFSIRLQGNVLHVRAGDPATWSTSSEGPTTQFLKACGHMSPSMLVHTAVLSGCDYASSLPGIGLIKAAKLVLKYANVQDDLRLLRVVEHIWIRRKKNFDQDEYLERAYKAEACFRHHLIFDTRRRKVIPLTALPENHFPTVRERRAYPTSFSSSCSLQHSTAQVSSNNAVGTIASPPVTPQPPSKQASLKTWFVGNPSAACPSVGSARTSRSRHSPAEDCRSASPGSAKSEKKCVPTPTGAVVEIDLVEQSPERTRNLSLAQPDELTESWQFLGTIHTAEDAVEIAAGRLHPVSKLAIEPARLAPEHNSTQGTVPNNDCTSRAKMAYGGAIRTFRERAFNAMVRRRPAREGAASSRAFRRAKKRPRTSAPAKIDASIPKDLREMLGPATEFTIHQDPASAEPPANVNSASGRGVARPKAIASDKSDSSASSSTTGMLQPSASFEKAAGTDSCSTPPPSKAPRAASSGANSKSGSSAFFRRWLGVAPSPPRKGLTKR